MIWCYIMQSLMINEMVNTVSKLQTALIAAEVYVSSLPKDTPHQSFEHRFNPFPSLEKSERNPKKAHPWTDHFCYFSG